MILLLPLFLPPLSDMRDNYHLVQGDKHSDSALINHSNVWNLRPEITSPQTSHYCFDFPRGSPHHTETAVPNLHLRGGQLGSDRAGDGDKSWNDSGGYGSRNEILRVSVELEGEEKYQTHSSHQLSDTYMVKRRGYICPILKEACPYMLTKESKCFRNFAELKYSLTLAHEFPLFL